MSSSPPSAAVGRGSLPALPRHPSSLATGTAPPVPSAAAASTAAGGKSRTVMPVCAHCGAVFTKATAKFCSKCGTKKAPSPALPAASGGGSSNRSQGGTTSSPRKHTKPLEAGEGGRPAPPPTYPRPSSGGRSAANRAAMSTAVGQQKGKRGSVGSVLDGSGSTLDSSSGLPPGRRSSASGTIPFDDSGKTGKAARAGSASAKKAAIAHPSAVAAQSASAKANSTGPIPLSAADVGGGGGAAAACVTSPHHRDVTALSENRNASNTSSAQRSVPPANSTNVDGRGFCSPSFPRGGSGQDRPGDGAAAAGTVEEAWPNNPRQSDSTGATTADTTATTTLTSGTMGSIKTLEPSEEEEAQYTALSTLGPEGLTPEMLQTQNAKTELKSWRRGSLIGRGTYGSVYLGLLSDGSFYAVKCVELGGKHVADMTFNVKELVSLSREINMMQRLRHRNLCSFKGVLYEADTTSICMFMEYVGGGSLSSIVKRFKPLPREVVRRWTRQLLSGLLYLHAQHTIHRDIKGDNVLIDTSATPESEAQVKLVDFGAARRLTDAVSQSRTVIGTPYWMAPEVVDVAGDGKGYSYKADVWSVGCTVAEMLTGRPPWPAKATAPAAIMMVASAEGMPTELPKEEASPGCYAFMLRCFERDPEKRPTVEELLQDPWILGVTE